MAKEEQPPMTLNFLLKEMERWKNEAIESGDFAMAGKMVAAIDTIRFYLGSQR